MHFNKSELSHIACLPSHEFNKEGVLIFLEKQDGFFKKSEVCSQRWCRLRGNLLFYFRNKDHCSDPVGVIVLENYQVVEEEFQNLPYSFTLVCEGSAQVLAAVSPKEKNSWISVIQRASIHHLRNQIDTLLQRIKINKKNCPISIAKYRMTTGATIDFSKPPFAEMTLSCDNLRCNGNGVPPSPRVSVFISKPPYKTWIRYGQTEVMERTSNPNFLSTITFRSCDGIDSDTRICFIVCDIRERVTDTSLHLGKTMIMVRDLMEVGKTRLFLLSPHKHTVGFITVNTWAPDSEGSKLKARNCHATPEREPNSRSPQTVSHRRTQSLPPRLTCEVKYPAQGSLKLIYENPIISTFRFHSGLGGDISIVEVMAEPFLCFKFPQQLLRLWINEEKLYQEEIASLGDLREEWSKHQFALHKQHSTLINMYGIALGSLEAQFQSGCFFKKSIDKEESALDFAPVNFHLQRLFAQNESLRRSEFYDIMTVGAFCASSLGFKNGGLLDMLQSSKASCHLSTATEHKAAMCEDIVENLRRLRKEIFLLLRLLLIALQNRDAAVLGRIIDQLQDKTNALLHILEPSLVIEAINFLDAVRQSSSGVLTLASKDYASNSCSGCSSPEPAVEYELSSPIIHAVFDNDDQSEKPLTDLFGASSYKNRIEEGVSEFCINSCYKSTDEPEPWDLTHLNIRASLICLSSKIKSFCSHLSSSSRSDIQSCSSKDDIVHGDYKEEAMTSQLDSGIGFSLATTTICSTGIRDSMSGIISADTSPCEEDSGIGIEKMSNELEKTDCVSEGNLSVEDDKREELPLDRSDNHCSLSISPCRGSLEDTLLPCVISSVNSSVDISPNTLNHTTNDLELQGSQATDIVQNLYDDKGINNSHEYTDMIEISLDEVYTPDAEKLDDDAAFLNNSSPPEEKETFNRDALRRISEETERDEDDICEPGDTRLSNGYGNDWMSEVKPSMRKLRQAIDGLLRTARLTSSVFRLKESPLKGDFNFALKYRRDICFSQALTSVVTALLTRIWCHKEDTSFILAVTKIGLLVQFEALLSCYRSEGGRLADMVVAVEDLKTVDFIMVPEGIFSKAKGPRVGHYQKIPTPRVAGTRNALRVILPVPEHMLSLLPCSANGHPSDPPSFRVTPVIFNIGINEEASLAAKLNKDTAQFRNNHNNFDRLLQYYSCYKKFILNDENERKVIPNPLLKRRNESLSSLMSQLHEEIFQQKSKNVTVLKLASQICRLMGGIRFTSCKSAKDRTGMSVTLEQLNILKYEFDLSDAEFKSALDCMRLEGTRIANCEKNTGQRRYAFSTIQLALFPSEYRPPPGSFGSSIT